MINYSISLRANPSDQDAPKKAYANAQYSEIMTLDKFAEHISTHGSKYNRADIQAVLIQAVDCMREQLLAGQRIQMGDLALSPFISTAWEPNHWKHTIPSSMWKT
mgnify:CR=1 FL=1